MFMTVIAFTFLKKVFCILQAILSYHVTCLNHNNVLNVMVMFLKSDYVCHKHKYINEVCNFCITSDIWNCRNKFQTLPHSKFTALLEPMHKKKS